VRLGRISEDRCQIGNASSFCPNLEPLDHALLNVAPRRISAWQNTLGSRDQDSARPRTEFQDSLPWSEIQAVESRPSQPR
jgi:hypothetical protein